jgi:hypothetical protein
VNEHNGWVPRDFWLEDLGEAGHHRLPFEEPVLVGEECLKAPKSALNLFRSLQTLLTLNHYKVGSQV